MDAMMQMAGVLSHPKPSTPEEKRREVNRRYYRQHRDRWIVYKVIDDLLRKRRTEAACS